MRDIVVALILLISIPICLVRPYFGVLMWYWVSYFNPHRFTFGFAYHLPVALMVAIPTLIGLIFARKSFGSLLALEPMLLIGLWAWYTITFIHAQSVPMFAGHITDGSYEMSHISKIIMMTVVMVLVTTTRQRLYGVMLVTGGSVGLLALKATIFGARTSGEARVFGPPDSFLADNNAFGLVVNVCLPILFFLARNERRRWLRLLLYACFLSGIVAVLLTYSRGGLVGLIVVLGVILLRSRHKIVGAVTIGLAILVILAIAPPAWMQRMGRFAEGDLDGTANQRFVSWGTAWNLSHDFPVTGGGFRTIEDEFIFKRYQPRALPGGLTASGPHSIYFQLLADQGFVGLGLFLILLLSCFITLFRARVAARRSAGTRWLVDYTYMVETALLGFMASGSFLGFVYLDLIYQMIGLTIVLKVILRQERVAVALATVHVDRQAEMLEEQASLA